METGRVSLLCHRLRITQWGRTVLPLLAEAAETSARSVSDQRSVSVLLIRHPSPSRRRAKPDPPPSVRLAQKANAIWWQIEQGGETFPRRLAHNKTPLNKTWCDNRAKQDDSCIIICSHQRGFHQSPSPSLSLACSILTLRASLSCLIVSRRVFIRWRAFVVGWLSNYDVTQVWFPIRASV